MNEITRIHLGRSAFTIAVPAHADLRAYLAAIKRRAGSEVAEEVELRMAELLVERGFDEKKVVLDDDVAYLKAQLGEPSDFADDEAADARTSSESDTTDKRLYRDTSRGWLGGVSSGIAAYVDAPEWLIRLLFVLLTFAWGGGILLYVILWVLLPDAKTPSDRLRMQGKPVTVETLKEFVDKVVEKAPIKENAREISDRAAAVATSTGTAVGRAISGVARAALAIIGSVLLVAGISGALYVIGMGSYVLANPDKLFDAGRLFPVGAAETWLVILGLFVAVLACSLLAIVGLALIRRRWPVPAWLTSGIIALILVGGAVATPASLAVAPKIADRYRAAHSTTTRSLNTFTAVKVIGSKKTDITFVPSSSYRLDITSTGTVNVKNIRTSIDKNKVLTIDTTDFYQNDSCGVFCIHTNHPQLVLRAPELAQIDVSSGINFYITRQLNQSALSIVADAGANFMANHIYADSTTLSDDNGRSKIVLSGLTPTDEDNGLYKSPYSEFMLDRAKMITYKGSHACELYEPLLVVNDTPGSITIGDTTFTSMDKFTATQSDSTPRTANCVTTTNYSDYLPD